MWCPIQRGQESAKDSLSCRGSRRGAQSAYNCRETEQCGGITYISGTRYQRCAKVTPGARVSLVLLILLGIRWTTWDSLRFAATNGSPFRVITLSKSADRTVFFCLYSYD